MALVSVIMPVFNAGPYIRASVESITNQSEHDLELIIVDDGSADDSLEIARSVARQDPRVRVQTIVNSGGPSRPRNAGLRAASGDFIAFQDADDIAHPARIASALAMFRRFPDVRYVFHDFTKFTSTIEEGGPSQLHELDFLRRAGVTLRHVDDGAYLTSPDFYTFLSLDVPVMWTGAVMFRRTLMDREPTGFPEDVRIGEDYDLWYRLIRGQYGAFIDRVLAYYRRHDTNLTNDPEQMLLGGINLHETNLVRGAASFTPADVRRYRERISALWFHLGVHYARNGREPAARAAYQKSMQRAPAAKIAAAYAKTWVPHRIARALRRWRSE